MREPVERPILFSAPMVRAILDGRKTQTRRLMNPQPVYKPYRDISGQPYMCWQWSRGPKKHGTWLTQSRNDKFDGRIAMDCPFGDYLDTLWVRETFLPDPPRDGTWEDFGGDFTLKDIPEEYRRPRHVLYAADPKWQDAALKWCPSIHMPAWASRLTLEIVRVDVQRLQDITEPEAKAEGVGRGWYLRDTLDGEETVPTTYRDGFRSQWNQIYGKALNLKETHGWDANPWVWAVSFSVVQQGDKS
jgi:hypothetical protein